MTGFFNSQYDVVDDYFHLKEENKRIHKMNDSLLNLLQLNFIKVDSTATARLDTVRYDTTNLVRRYYIREAKVVSNSINSQKNYIQINRGSNQGIKDNMSVINSDGSLVGQVVGVSENFSQVMSLLNVQSRASAMMKKSRISGRIEWDGKNPLFLTMYDIPKSDSVLVGDSVLTGLLTYNFQPGWMIGTVAEIVEDKSTNFYILKVRPSANFQNLQQVFVIENLQRDEQAELDKTTQKKVDELNKRKS